MRIEVVCILTVLIKFSIFVDLQAKIPNNYNIHSDTCHICTKYLTIIVVHAGLTHGDL